MRGAGLNDGDWVDADLTAKPKDGDFVLAEVEGMGLLLRTLRVIGGAQLLWTDNAELRPFPIDDPAKIVYMGVVRRPAR